MSSRKPPWWRAFDKVERTIGEPLENAAASNRYVDVMLSGMRLQRAIGGGVGRVVGGVAGTVLRVANVPTRTDVRRINRQLAVLTTEVRALADEQRAARPTSRRRAARPAARAAVTAPDDATSISAQRPEDSSDDHG